MTRSCRPMKPCRQRSAFTLVELLVVLAIVGILASLLLPALAKAKSRGEGMKCLSHMRQWGFALSVYSGDNDDRLPRDGTDDAGAYAVDTQATVGPGSPNDPYAWFNVLPTNAGENPLSNYWAGATRPREQLPFPGGVGALWHCPAARATRNERFLADGVFGFFSIVMNADLKLLRSLRNDAGGISLAYPEMPRLGGIAQPAATVLLTDVAFSPTLEPYSARSDRNGVEPAGYSRNFAQRHSNRGGNLVFVDGHAAFFPRRYITNGAAAREEKFNHDVVWNPNREKF